MEGDELETGASTFISTSLVSSSSEESSEDESSLEDSCRDAKRRRWNGRREEERRVSSPQKFQPTTRELLHRPSMNEKLNSQQR